MTPIRTVMMIAISTASLALAACGAGGDGGTAAGDAIAKITAPAGKQWSQMVVPTADGFRMGNPDAPLKLIEFASPTCSHCAEFSRTGAEGLKTEFVDSGRVSVEVRPFMLNPFDLVIASLLQCAGPERFFPLLENNYQSQEELFAGLQGDQAAIQAAAAQPEATRFAALARAAKLDQYFAARGIPETQTATCLASTASVNHWAESTERNGKQYEITGTPTFVLNERVMTGAATWEAVRDGLRAAGAR
ncbi:MAG: thioredoxin domain-containing protein [Sphingopyxis sp.]